MLIAILFTANRVCKIINMYYHHKKLREANSDKTSRSIPENIN